MMVTSSSSISSVRDAYALLGVPTKATDNDVRSAYRQLIRRYHPDSNGGDRTAEDRLLAVQQAYEKIGQARSEGDFVYTYSTALATRNDAGNAASVMRERLNAAYSAGVANPVVSLIDVRA